MFGVSVEVVLIGLAVVGLARVARSCRSLAGRLFVVVLIVVFVGFNGLSVWLACEGPGPAGFNVITGEGLLGPGQYGPTWRNISAGLASGTGVAVIGLAGAGLARLALWAVARR